MQYYMAYNTISYNMIYIITSDVAYIYIYEIYELINPSSDNPMNVQWEYPLHRWQVYIAPDGR